MSQLDNIKSPVSSELKSFERQFRHSVKSEISLLNIIMNYILKTKGKQIRPLFVLLTAKLHGGIKKSTYTAASLIELLHTATLIHDDVVDESYERRGFFSINALWKSKVAVLIGDYLLSRGLLLSIENNELELLKIVSSAVREMSEGELLQIQKSRKLNITEAEYFEIIRKKTATLIAACCACGAHSAGANNDTVSKMWEFGLMLGVAFQIKDDLLDYNGKGITGKPTANDIKEKKLTLPLIYSLSTSKTSMSNKILRIVNRNTKNNQSINDVINYVKDSGGIEYAERKMTEYKNKSLEKLSGYPSSSALDSIKALSEFVISRIK
jgi:octaprenyl-diphosphate synthase